MARHWIDRATAVAAPRWTLKRQRARIAADLLQRHYEGAGGGRRTQGWRRSSGDANAVLGPALTRLRDSARDLVRNNPYAESALSTISDHAVGDGIIAKPLPTNKAMLELWEAWAETTACDADGRHDIYGLQKLVMRTVVESGEVLVRRRLRRPEDGLPIPMQIQVIDPDYLDTSRDQDLAGGGRIIQGVQYNALGKREGYWLFSEHPGALYGSYPASKLIPAESIQHVFRPLRPGQVRGATWYAPVLLRFKDFDEFEDATLMKQKIAACLSVITTDVEGSSPPLGTASAGDTEGGLETDALEPGAIINAPPGRSITVVDPPTVAEYADYSKTQLRAIATGLGVTYEDLTGDYGSMPYSAARMSRLRHWARVEDWRWRILIPQFCNPVWTWFAEVATVSRAINEPLPAAWTCSPAPMVDPVNEGLAYQRLVRMGLQSLSGAIRERGYDPDELLDELAADFKKLDKLGLILDSDPRNVTQAGQLQGEAAALAKAEADAAAAAKAAAPAEDPPTPARVLGLPAGWSGR